MLKLKKIVFLRSFRVYLMRQKSYLVDTRSHTTRKHIQKSSFFSMPTLAEHSIEGSQCSNRDQKVIHNTSSTYLDEKKNQREKYCLSAEKSVTEDHNEYVPYISTDSEKWYPPSRVDSHVNGLVRLNTEIHRFRTFLRKKCHFFI